MNRLLQKHYISYQWVILGFILWQMISTSFQIASHDLVYPVWLQRLDKVLSVILLIDIILKWRGLRYQGPGQLSFSASEKNSYRHSVFIIYDVIAAVPFQWMIGVFDLDGIWQWLPVLTGLRLVRFFYFRRNLTLASRFSKLLLGTVFGFVFVHFIACVWMWIYPDPSLKAADFYVRSLYWAVTTLTTIGYGDIVPSSNLGRIYTMLVMITGAGMYTVLIGNVSRIILAADKHREGQKEKISEISSFMDYYQVPRAKQQQVFQFINAQARKRLSEDDQEIIAGLPLALQSDLKIYMSVKMVRSVPLFRNCPLEGLKRVSRCLEQKFYTPGEAVVRAGDIGNEMFLVGNGFLDVVDEEGNVIATLSEGQPFGEMALMEDERRTATVRAKSYCDLYILEREDFDTLQTEFPQIRENASRIINERKRME